MVLGYLKMSELRELWMAGLTKYQHDSTCQPNSTGRSCQGLERLLGVLQRLRISFVAGSEALRDSWILLTRSVVCRSGLRWVRLLWMFSRAVDAVDGVEYETWNLADWRPWTLWTLCDLVWHFVCQGSSDFQLLGVDSKELQPRGHRCHTLGSEWIPLGSRGIASETEDFLNLSDLCSWAHQSSKALCSGRSQGEVVEDTQPSMFDLFWIDCDLFWSILIYLFWSFWSTGSIFTSGFYLNCKKQLSTRAILWLFHTSASPSAPWHHWHRAVRFVASWCRWVHWVNSGITSSESTARMPYFITLGYYMWYYVRDIVGIYVGYFFPILGYYMWHYPPRIVFFLWENREDHLPLLCKTNGFTVSCRKKITSIRAGVGCCEAPLRRGFSSSDGRKLGPLAGVKVLDMTRVLAGPGSHMGWPHSPFYRMFVEAFPIFSRRSASWFFHLPIFPPWFSLHFHILSPWFSHIFSHCLTWTSVGSARTMLHADPGRSGRRDHQVGAAQGGRRHPRLRAALPARGWRGGCW